MSWCDDHYFYQYAMCNCKLLEGIFVQENEGQSSLHLFNLAEQCPPALQTKNMDITAKFSPFCQSLSSVSVLNISRDTLLLPRVVFGEMCSFC